MNKYELVFEAVQEAYDNNEITLEEAEFLNDYAYNKYITESELTKKEKKEKKKQYKQKEIDKEFLKYGGSLVQASRKTVETLDKSHRYIAKLANNRDDESDKKIATAYNAIRHITKSPKNSTIEYSTPREYTGKKYPDDEDFAKNDGGYYYSVITYPHSDTDKKGKPITYKDKTMTHVTKKDYEGDPRPSQYSFGHSKTGGYENKTRLHPKKRVYGFPESHDNSGHYASYGSKKKIVDTKGKPIYKNAESSEGGFIEY